MVEGYGTADLIREKVDSCLGSGVPVLQKSVFALHLKESLLRLDDGYCSSVVIAGGEEVLKATFFQILCMHVHAGLDVDTCGALQCYLPLHSTCRVYSYCCDGLLQASDAHRLGKSMHYFN